MAFLQTLAGSLFAGFALRESILAGTTFQQNAAWVHWVEPPNATEPRFGEVRRRTRPMGVFQDRTSMERILFAVFTHENKMQGISAPFLLTQTN
jgi:transposase-like protein